MPKTGPGVNDQVPTRASAGVVPPMLKGMPKHVLSAAMNGLAAAEQAGLPVSISKFGGFRTRSMQKALYANRNRNPNPVAHPGDSQHEKGLAIDIASGGGLAQQKKLAKILEPFGWAWAGEVDPVHFDFTGSEPGDKIGVSRQGREGQGKARQGPAWNGEEAGASGATASGASSRGSGDSPRFSLEDTPPPAPPPSAKRTARPSGPVFSLEDHAAPPGVNFTPDVPAAVRSYPWHQFGATDVTPRAFRTRTGQLYHYQMVNGRPQVMDPVTGQPVRQTVAPPPAPAPSVLQHPIQAATSFFSPGVRTVTRALTGASTPSEVVHKTLAAPQVVDNIGWAAVNVLAKHDKAKGFGALTDPATWHEMQAEMHRAAGAKPGSVAAHVVETETGMDPSMGWRAFPAFLADAGLDFFFSPSNLLAGPIAEHTIVPGLKGALKLASPRLRQLVEAAAERSPQLKTALEQAGGRMRVGKLGKAVSEVERAALDTKAKLTKQAGDLAVQIRNDVVESRRNNPEYRAAENAFQKVHGKTRNRLQELVTLYATDQGHALRLAAQEGIPAATVEKYGQEFQRQVDETLHAERRFHLIPGPEQGGAHFRPGSQERNEFVQGMADRMFGRPAKAKKVPKAGVAAPVEAAPPTTPTAPPTARQPGWMTATERPPEPPPAAPATTPPPAPRPTPSAPAEKPPWQVRAEERANRPPAPPVEPTPTPTPPPAAPAPTATKRRVARLTLPEETPKGEAKPAPPVEAQPKAKGKKAAAPAATTPRQEAAAIFGERPKAPIPKAAQEAINELRKTNPEAAARLEAAQRGAGPAAAVEGPKSAPPTAKPTAEPVVRQRGEARTGVRIDPSRMDVPAEAQRTIARLITEDPEKAQRLAKKFGVTREEAEKWAAAQAGETAKKGRYGKQRPGYISLFADSAKKAGAPENVANVMAVPDRVGSKEGRRTVETLARQHGLEAAAQSGLVEDLKPGEKPRAGWAEIPDKPAYGELAGKQAPIAMRNAIRNIAENPFMVGSTEEIEQKGKRALLWLSRQARLTMLHPAANPIGLVTSTGARMAQMELGMEEGLREAAQGKGFKAAAAGMLTRPFEKTALAPASASAAKELGAWWRKGVDSEAMKALDEHFPTWRTSYVTEGQAERRAENLAAGGHFVKVLGKDVYIPPDWGRTLGASGGAAHAQLDQWAKLSLFKALRGKVGDARAAAIVKDVLFDYADQNHILEAANRYGFWVFNAVPTKQAGLALRTLVRHPDLLVRYPRLRNFFFASQPGSEEQYKTLKPWQQKPFVFPFGKDENGRYIFRDPSRWTPFAGFFDEMHAIDMLVRGKDKREPLDILMSKPLIGPALWALGMGRSTLTGQPLSRPGTSRAEDWQKRLETVGEGAKFTTWRDVDRLQRAYAGETTSASREGEAQTPAEAWAQVLGLPSFKGEPTEAAQALLDKQKVARNNSMLDFVKTLATGYSAKKNPHLHDYDDAQPTKAGIRDLVIQQRNITGYLMSKYYAANSFDGKNNLKDEVKDSIQDAYNRSMAIQTRMNQLTKQYQEKKQ